MKLITSEKAANIFKDIDKKSFPCTIARDEISCVVFGMPNKAIKPDAADKVLPLDQIPHLLLKCIDILYIPPCC